MRVRWCLGEWRETGSVGQLTRLGDIKESSHVEQLTIIWMRGKVVRMSQYHR